jgi:serine/threonine protein kinase/tetratricopeptide (TPR) repeat protein
MQENSMDDLTGKIISHYKVIKQVGQGGMGVIYLAEDTRLERKVALKLLPQFLTADEESNQNFKREAQIIASLNHPNIVTIYEIDNFNGQYYLSFEFLEGENLRQKIKKPAGDEISLENIIDIFLQICSGLSKAHNAGVIHGDIKPENIFINKDNIVKILDFGVAKLIGSSSVANEEKNIFGTTAYMSPEQIHGENTARESDIWSLGVLLYEMLSEELPFRGEYEQSVIYSILNEEPVKIKNRFASEGELEKIVLKCLRKPRNERFNSVEELISEIKSVRKNTARPALKSADPQELQNVIDSLTKPALELYKPSEIFTGREEQLNFLEKKIGDIYGGKGSAVFIQGEPGIGKTQLVYQAINSSAHADLNVLLGRCLYNVAGLPYHPFASAVKTAYSLNSRVEDYFINALNKYAEKLGVSLSSSLPFIKSFLGFSVEPVSLLNKEQLWNAVLTLYKIISRGEPLVLIVDDLQWSDKTTLGLFSFIARNCSSLPILLIGIHRPPEFLSPGEKNKSLFLTQTIRQLRIEGLADRIKLERFSKEETELLLFKILNSPSEPQLAENVFQNTEGNPLFISELIKLLKEKNYIKKDESAWRLEKQIQLKQEIILTEKVQDVIHQRIDRLDANLREILEVASCEGEDFEAEPLTACLNIDKLSLLKFLSTIEKEHRLIRHEKNSYKFDHILIKEVLYRNILFELRQEYHKLLADYLINKHGNNDEYASTISHHLLESGNEEKAVPFLVSAANKARELYAAEDAVKFYKKAGEIFDKLKSEDLPLIMNVEEGLGDIYLLIGNTEEAVDKFYKYLELARKAQNKVKESIALRKASEVYRVQGKIKEAYNLCSMALDISKEIDNEQELMHCLNNMSMIHSSRGEYNSAIELSKQALAPAKNLNDLKSQSISFSNIGLAYWHMGIYPSAMEYLNDALGIQRSIGDNLGLSITLNFLGLVYWKLGKYEDALKCSFESLNIKTAVGDFGKIPGTLNVIADIYREVNELERAIEFHTRSLSIAKENQNKGAMCDNIRDLGEDYFLLGETEKALKFFEEALELAKNSGLIWYETRSYISMSELFSLTGNEEKALHYSNLGLEYANKINAKDLIIETLWNQAKVKASAESYNEIRKLYLVAIEIAESVGHKTFLWKLYKDFSRFLKDNSKTFESNIYRNKSSQILNNILSNLEEDLKRSFLNSSAVKEVLRQK